MGTCHSHDGLSSMDCQLAGKQGREPPDTNRPYGPFSSQRGVTRTGTRATVRIDRSPAPGAATLTPEPVPEVPGGPAPGAGLLFMRVGSPIVALVKLTNWCPPDHCGCAGGGGSNMVDAFRDAQ